MTIISLNQATAAFPTGITCDDYAYQYSNSYAPAVGHGPVSAVIFNSGYGNTSGINWTLQVSNDLNETYWADYTSGTLTGPGYAIAAISGSYALTRVGMRIDISGGTALSGFAWVAP